LPLLSEDGTRRTNQKWELGDQVTLENGNLLLNCVVTPLFSHGEFVRSRSLSLIRLPAVKR
jgi:hypothetical protein